MQLLTKYGKYVSLSFCWAGYNYAPRTCAYSIVFYVACPGPIYVRRNPSSETLASTMYQTKSGITLASLNIETIRDLADNRFVHIAQTIVSLALIEEMEHWHHNSHPQ